MILRTSHRHKEPNTNFPSDTEFDIEDVSWVKYLADRDELKREAIRAFYTSNSFNMNLGFPYYTNGPAGDFTKFALSGYVSALRRVRLNFRPKFREDEIRFFSWIAKSNNSPSLTVYLGEFCTYEYAVGKMNEMVSCRDSLAFSCASMIEILLHAYDLISLRKQQNNRTIPCVQIEPPLVRKCDDGHCGGPHSPVPPHGREDRPMTYVELTAIRKIIVLVSSLLPDLLSSAEALSAAVPDGGAVPVWRNWETIARIQSAVLGRDVRGLEARDIFNRMVKKVTTAPMQDTGDTAHRAPLATLVMPPDSEDSA